MSDLDEAELEKQLEAEVVLIKRDVRIAELEAGLAKLIASATAWPQDYAELQKAAVEAGELFEEGSHG